MKVKYKVKLYTSLMNTVITISLDSYGVKRIVY
nr:MAG TPA: hypothetical protein [Crassvirales sp.]DAI58498.1 MAG TPA: hypothetical protein [Crassvirales sp.]DAX10943.1 MAG TPA: hypothetical protein [Bacteriophage sp.]DAY68813.1 MAG TPA: hypothetical protein [Caudoviricetes sp.]